jgi:hypothetical protein
MCSNLNSYTGTAIPKRILRTCKANKNLRSWEKPYEAEASRTVLKPSLSSSNGAA